MIRVNTVASKAFTLIEMILATVLVAMFAGMVSSSYFNRYRSAVLNDSVMQLKAMADYARNKAAAEGRQYSLVFGAGNKVMLASVKQPENQKQSGSTKTTESDSEEVVYEPVDNNYCKPVTMADYIKVSQFEVDSGEEENESSSEQETTKLERSVNFYPQGGADSALISLTNGTKIVSLTISPSTGRAKVYKGKITTPPAKREDLDLGDSSDYNSENTIETQTIGNGSEL